MNPRFLLAASLLAFSVLAPAAARADMPGKQGQIVIRSDFDFSLSYAKTSNPSSAPAGSPDPDARIQIGLSPAADYFVAPGVSIGGLIGVVYGKKGDSSLTSLQLGPRVGYYANFGPGIGIWPQVAFLYNTSKTSFKVGNDTQSSSSSSTALQISAPLVIELVDHFFIGLGPYLSLDLSVPDGQGKTTTLGVATQVGGYF